MSHLRSCGLSTTIFPHIISQHATSKHMSYWAAVVGWKADVCNFVLTPDISMPLFPLSGIQQWYIQDGETAAGKFFFRYRIVIP